MIVVDVADDDDVVDVAFAQVFYSCGLQEEKAVVVEMQQSWQQQMTKLLMVVVYGWYYCCSSLYLHLCWSCPVIPFVVAKTLMTKI